MIYTVGNTESYLRAFSEQVTTPKKVGRDLNWKTEKHPNGFPGGSVWQTREAAQSYLDTHSLGNYSVFGVEADWETQTAVSQGGEWRDLLVDSYLVLLDTK